ncbi:hypothetical protein [Dyadobacter sp. CY323]|uniref:hypothetical protein n=1 Tax=Dyadobacter sp. CY323 TaxID=2907302 RepID=UPI001F4747F8|nr:hypothetical protein [Dyadobacter sp. CY323]MCE6991235.1 hypothetical protein [Dyadobacter sp. CY323]
MKKVITSVVALFLLGQGALYAQSANSQATAKTKTPQEQSGEGGKNTTQKSKRSSSKEASSQATAGIPPTHLDPKNSVPLKSNPQNDGVNASQRKASQKSPRSSKKSDALPGSTSGRSGQQAKPQSAQP